MIGKTTLEIGKFAAALAVAGLGAVTACAGKSKGGGDESNDDDRGGGGTAGVIGRGGSSGSGGSGIGGTGGANNVLVMTVNTQPVHKIDLLFMIDNSISMAHKQQVLADAVPVLIERLVDPICVDSEGDPIGGNASAGCTAGGRPEFIPMRDIHIGIITSSLGNHGGDVCVSDPAEMPPRNLNDGAQLIPSVRDAGLYSYRNAGFLVWDPTDPRPAVDPHPGLTNHETDIVDFVADVTSHVEAVGERGCGYEASLEAWYRFLIDPEPVREVTTDGQFSVRGPINPVVLEQRRNFLRPDSVLAIVMLTDENDCSIDDEDDHQGWLVGRRQPMPRGSDACAHPENPEIYRCCIPCVLLDVPSFAPSPGCSYAGDAACSQGSSLPPLEDSTNLRCYDQVRRFGLNLLYPWQRYSQALMAPRIALRTPDSAGNTEIQNPIYTPGADGTPAREPGRVFLVGIVGVPWQDIATGDSLPGGPHLEFLTAAEMANPPVGTPGGNRWDVILGDPDTGRLPTDPFMVETNGMRSGMNPITAAAITPPLAGNTGNEINGHEQNIVNQDDLQYACTFDVPDVDCTQANQDGCDCNAAEEAYLRPTCEYPGGGMDGTQTHAKAYPSVRHLQVLKAFGDNAIVASICAKSTVAQGSPATDPNYGYNPAVNAMVERFKETLLATCLPRPLAANDDGEIPCSVVEARLPTSAASCSCDAPGRTELTDETITAGVRSELTSRALCGPGTQVSCAEYCLCEIDALTGANLATCQESAVDPATIHGYCYVDPDNGHGSPDLVADCPDTQRQLIRFMGQDVPAPNSIAFVACGGQ